ncbi:hypothetical protein E1A91_D11G212100v1 [Gossypium mustelinum]|uniref:TF-B3 domain-containing protein n=1 Tax=Gossypium mustelinum TaxID=34275 RepID=A0A5D2SUV5_GOSMU|nr:hypothetical protein E1A91_D11G212100v1 [Gossypium mustelinum]
MAATTQKCRVLEKNKYWKEFESNRHRFFKILVGDFRNHLRVPKKFTENFREKLLGTIHRRGPSGFMWTVEVEKMFNHVVFQNGWPTFVEEHRLEKADLLVFRYIGNSAFNVVIFDSSGCVREGSYFVREHTNACSNDGCVLDKEDGEDCEDIIDLEKPPIYRKGRSRREEEDQKKRPRVIKSAVEEEVSIDEPDGAPGCAMEDCVEQNLQGSYSLYFILKRREITEEEKQRPRKLSRQRTLLGVPPQNKVWDVRIRSSIWGTAFTRGWAKFVLDNNLGSHDTCVFELSDEGKANGYTMVFDVIIFRVLDEIVPLKKFSRTQTRTAWF